MTTEKSTQLLEKIRRALDLETKHDYVNFPGHQASFADFMAHATSELESREAKELSRRYGLYSDLDLPARLELIRRSYSWLRQYQVSVSPGEVWEVSISSLPGIKPNQARLLERAGISTIYDLFIFWPHCHLDLGQATPISALRAGQHATVVATVKRAQSFQSPRKANLTIVNVILADRTGSLALTRFIAGKSGKFVANQFLSGIKEGTEVLARGQVGIRRGHPRYQLDHFELTTIGDFGQKDTPASGLLPLYPLPGSLGQANFRGWLREAWQLYGARIPSEVLPAELVQEMSLPGSLEACQEMHFPSSSETLHGAKRRLAFEEFLLLQRAIGTSPPSPRQALALSEEGPVNRLLRSLPFDLTDAQVRVAEEIRGDMGRERPMNRLLQGDVGSGKTVVAVLAMLMALERGQQAALMAPTEILAEQHYRKLQEWLLPLGLSVGLLIGSQKAANRKRTLGELETGQLKLAVGTHALIQDEVRFRDLGLAVVDEQHRFGVRQRDSLSRKGNQVDRLFMTATPIPRTLALATYGNLDVSELDERPPGRKPIKTKVVEAKNRRAAHEFVKQHLAAGRQAYVVYPLIEESETLSAKAVTEEADKLRRIYRGYEIEVLHGKMPVDEKDAVMARFRSNQTQVLVGTTVIEVGVDVPNATIMIIENSERFGLSQLHQLRGRVGRGSEQSYCLLFGDTSNAGDRLRVMEESENGFYIAQKDLEMRGPGELVGTRQSGLSDFALSCLAEHGDLMERAREVATTLDESQLHPAYRQRLERQRLRINNMVS